MAYKDADGRITIDEEAAKKDVKRLRDAIAILQNSYDSLERMANEAQTLKGSTSMAITDKSIEMKNRVKALIKKMQEAADFIDSTVAHYRKLDAELKAAIEAASVIGAAAAGASGVNPASNPGHTAGRK